MKKSGLLLLVIIVLLCSCTTSPPAKMYTWEDSYEGYDKLMMYHNDYKDEDNAK